MKVAIMQPYIFPYLGYFQLVHAADDFVFYDDVNFIKQGWINRNRILVAGSDYLFTVPVEKISSFATIKDTLIHIRNYEVWKRKFLKCLQQSYSRAPFYESVMVLIENVLEKKVVSIAELAQLSVVTMSNYLRMSTNFVTSSVTFSNTKGLEKSERIITITKTLGSKEYINPIGGSDLYDKKHFHQSGVHLSFIKPKDAIVYKQFRANDFVPWLSMIDVLMFNSIDQANELISKYELI